MRGELRVQLAANEADPELFLRAVARRGTFVLVAAFLRRVRV
jgi:hypothetical protein